MAVITEITYEQCLPLWEMLWAKRTSPIEPTSAMILPADRGEVREYSTQIGTPTFIGIMLHGELIGVNSFHTIGEDQTRSRGLYVLGAHRGKGVGTLLLSATIVKAPAGRFLWSYPKEESLNTYLRAGFVQASNKIVDTIENKSNYYVTFPLEK